MATSRTPHMVPDMPNTIPHWAEGRPGHTESRARSLSWPWATAPGENTSPASHPRVTGAGRGGSPRTPLTGWVPMRGAPPGSPGRAGLWQRPLGLVPRTRAPRTLRGVLSRPRPGPAARMAGADTEPVGRSSPAVAWPPRSGAPGRPPGSGVPLAALPSQQWSGGRPLPTDALEPWGASPAEGRGIAPHNPWGGRTTGGPVPSFRPGGAIVVAGEVARSATAHGNRSAHPTGPPLTGEYDANFLGDNRPVVRGICFPVAGCSLPPTDGRPAGGTRRGTGDASDPRPRPRPDHVPGSVLWAQPLGPDYASAEARRCSFPYGGPATFHRSMVVCWPWPTRR